MSKAKSSYPKSGVDLTPPACLLLMRILKIVLKPCPDNGCVLRGLIGKLKTMLWNWYQRHS